MSDKQAGDFLFLVSDRLASPGGVRLVRISDFVADLRAGRYDPPAALPRLVAGQGIGRGEADYLQAELRRCGLERVLEMAPGHALEQHLISRRDVHKHHGRNVLVANLMRLDETRYQAALWIHNENDFLLDHTTGQHIQGMLILEAARQMTYAAVEHHSSAAGFNADLQWIIGTWNTEFQSFLSPLPVLMDCRLTEAQEGDVGGSGAASIRMHSVVDFIQAESTAVTTSMTIIAYDRTRISRLEKARTQRTISRLDRDLRPLPTSSSDTSKTSTGFQRAI